MNHSFYSKNATMQKVKSIWRSLENILFLGFSISILYVTIGSFIDGSIKSFMGMGYLNNMADPIQKKIYYQSVMALLSMLTTFFLLVEIIRLFVTMNPFKNLFDKHSRIPLKSSKMISILNDWYKYLSIFKSMVYRKWVEE